MVSEQLPVLFIGLFGLFWLVDTAHVPKCDLHVLDKCSQNVFFFAKSVQHPENALQVDRDCHYEHAALDCIEDYAKTCLKGVPRAMVKLLMDGTGTEIYAKCNKTHPRRAEYFEHIQCANRVGVALHGCMKNLASILESASLTSPKLRIGLSCCSFGIYRSCIRTAMRSACDRQHVKYADSIINSVVGELQSTVCLNFKPGSKQCKALPPLGAVSNPQFLTLLPPLTEVLKVLGSH